MGKQASMTDVILYAHGAAAFQLLRAGVELGLFELLDKKPLSTQKEIAKALKIPVNSARVLLFGLSALDLVAVSKLNNYSNVKSVQKLISRGEWPVFRALVRFQAYIVYPGQADYAESLIAGKNVGTGRFPGNGDTLYKRLDNDKKLQDVFYEYMEAYSEYSNPHLIKALDLSNAKSVLDVGGGGAGNAVALAKAFKNIEITLIDLPIIEKIAATKIKRNKLEKRIVFKPADMHKNAFPKNQDAVLFIHQMMIWSPEQNKALMKKAYDALNPGGQIVIFGSVSEDDERGPLMAALDTVYFSAVAAGQGVIYPWKDYVKPLEEVGFKNIKKNRSKTWTPHGVIIAQK